MFDHFDADKNGQLSAEELATLLRQCFPTRAEDAAALAAEFAAADADGSGGVSFDEFVEYHNALV